MTSGPTPVLTRAIKILFFLFLVFAGLYFARPFLVPVAFGGIIAMLFLPICRKLEEKRFPKALAAISCIFFVSALRRWDWCPAGLASFRLSQ